MGKQFYSSIVPEDYHSDARRLFYELGDVWNAYLRGQLILSLTMGVAVLMAALILGVPNAPILGLLSALLEFIPNIGPLLALIPAALLVGRPLTLDGDEQPASDRARGFARALARHFDLPVIEVDERSSSRIAAARFAQGRRDGLRRRSQGDQLDADAAAVLEEVLASNGKALIFTQFRQMGHLLTLMLRHDLDCETLFLHGGTPQNKRQQMIDRFQSPSGAPVFVLSLKAGGLGLNLTTAAYVFLLDPWWNPAVEAQAIDRAHRIGQTRQVFACRLIARDTVEERVLELQQSKRDLADALVSADQGMLRQIGSAELELLLS